MDNTNTIETRTPTKYRIISDNHWDYLQYLTIKKHFFFWTKEVWSYVWKPYYDKIYGRSLSSVCEWDIWINSLEDGNLEKFTKKWIYIEDYFKEAKVEQDRLIAKAQTYNKEIAERKNKIK